MVIREVASEFEIERLLKTFDTNFTKSLEKRIPNLTDYATKLFNNSVNKVAVSENTVLGFIFFYCNDIVSRKAFISQFCIADKCRRTGIGTFLLENVIDYCRKEKMSSIELEVNKTNHVARCFYEKHGFAVWQEIPTYDSLLMKKNI
ncbi:MAG: GNAT family N-acetyltransferase [Treponema sp.]|nr:GNAT family N-acetyltransferase [Treponema sp.]